MSIIIDKNFYSSVPQEAVNIVSSKIDKFKQELEENNHLINKLSKGFYCRPIKSTSNRYKFRVNNGDRIVFCYENKKRDIRLLRYCNHDRQILTAKNIVPAFAIVESSYKKDDFDEKVDLEILNEYRQYLLDNDLIGAYNILTEKISPKLNEAKFMRHVLKMEDMKRLYEIGNCGQKSSGININMEPDTNSVVTRDDLYHIFNKLYQEYHLILSPYMHITFPYSHLLDMPFFSENANNKKNIHEYIQTLTDEIYNKTGTITKNRKMALQCVFFYTLSKSELRPVCRCFNADTVMNTITRLHTKFVVVAEEHNDRENYYIHALSIMKPQKIGKLNFKYLFE